MLFGWSVKASIHSVNCHRWQWWHLLDLGETYTAADARKRCFYNSFQTSFRLVLTCSFTPSSVKAIFTKMTSYLATDSMMAIHFYRLRPTRSLTSLASWDASFMTQTASMWHMFHWSLATDFKFFYKIYKFFEGNLILKKRLFFFISLLRFIFIKCSCLVFSVNIRWKSFISWTWKMIGPQVYPQCLSPMWHLADCITQICLSSFLQGCGIFYTLTKPSHQRETSGQPCALHLPLLGHHYVLNARSESAL